MMNDNQYPACRRARVFYYDVLSSDFQKDVPEDIARHIRGCSYCQREIEEIRVQLETSVSAESVREQVRSNLGRALELQFAFVDRVVTCETVKYFLPGLAGGDFEITRPTPIMVHIENCPTCSSAFQAIKQMRLSARQLYRLTRMLIEKPAASSNECSVATQEIPSAAALNFEGISVERLNHISACPDCRTMLYKARQTMRDELEASSKSPRTSCPRVSSADMFEYVLPYGLDAKDKEEAQLPESVVSHVRHCPVCLDRILELHRMVYDIIDCEESGIITRFTIPASEETTAPGDADAQGVRSPVKVEIVDTRTGHTKVEKTFGVSDYATAEQFRGVTFINALKRRWKSAFTAAAAVLILASMLVNVPYTQAIALGEVYEAIGRINNVRRMILDADGRFRYEIWASRTLNLRLYPGEREHVLWDLSNGVNKTKNLSTNSVSVRPIPPNQVVRFEKSIAKTFGLAPFSKITDVPEGAQWNRVDDPELEASIPGTEIYDLIWSRSRIKGIYIENYKWRVFVDTATNLPKRSEAYKKRDIHDLYTLESVTVVEYPTESEIQAFIERIFD